MLPASHTPQQFETLKNSSLEKAGEALDASGTEFFPPSSLKGSGQKPDRPNPAQVLQLQRTIGNQATIKYLARVREGVSVVGVIQRDPTPEEVEAFNALAAKITGDPFKSKLASAKKIIDLTPAGTIGDKKPGYLAAQTEVKDAYGIASKKSTQNTATINTANEKYLAYVSILNEISSNNYKLLVAASMINELNKTEKKLLKKHYDGVRTEVGLPEYVDSKPTNNRITRKFMQFYGTAQQKAQIATEKEPDSKLIKKGTTSYISNLLAKGKIGKKWVEDIYRTKYDPAPNHYSVKASIDGMTRHVVHAHMTGFHVVAEGGGPSPVHIKKTTGNTIEGNVPSYTVAKADWWKLLPTSKTIQEARNRTRLAGDPVPEEPKPPAPIEVPKPPEAVPPINTAEGKGDGEPSEKPIVDVPAPTVEPENVEELAADVGEENVASPVVVHTPPEDAAEDPTPEVAASSEKPVEDETT